MSFNITPVASGYQEIHPYSAMNIDSVKINISLIMMKECAMLIELNSDIRIYDVGGLSWSTTETKDKSHPAGGL